MSGDTNSTFGTPSRLSSTSLTSSVAKGDEKSKEESLYSDSFAASESELRTEWQKNRQAEIAKILVDININENESISEAKSLPAARGLGKLRKWSNVNKDKKIEEFKLDLDDTNSSTDQSIRKLRDRRRPFSRSSNPQEQKRKLEVLKKAFDQTCDSLEESTERVMRKRPRAFSRRTNQNKQLIDAANALLDGEDSSDESIEEVLEKRRTRFSKKHSNKQNVKDLDALHDTVDNSLDEEADNDEVAIAESNENSNRAVLDGEDGNSLDESEESDVEDEVIEIVSKRQSGGGNLEIIDKSVNADDGQRNELEEMVGEDSPGNRTSEECSVRSDENSLDGDPDEADEEAILVIQPDSDNRESKQKDNSVLVKENKPDEGSNEDEDVLEIDNNVDLGNVEKQIDSQVKDNENESRSFQLELSMSSGNQSESNNISGGRNKRTSKGKRNNSTFEISKNISSNGILEESKTANSRASKRTDSIQNNVNNHTNNSLVDEEASAVKEVANNTITLDRSRASLRASPRNLNRSINIPIANNSLVAEEVSAEKEVANNTITLDRSRASLRASPRNSNRSINIPNANNSLVDEEVSAEKEVANNTITLDRSRASLRASPRNSNRSINIPNANNSLVDEEVSAEKEVANNTITLDRSRASLRASPRNLNRSINIPNDSSLVVERSKRNSAGKNTDNSEKSVMNDKSPGRFSTQNVNESRHTLGDAAAAADRSKRSSSASRSESNITRKSFQRRTLDRSMSLKGVNISNISNDSIHLDIEETTNRRGRSISPAKLSPDEIPDVINSPPGFERTRNILTTNVNIDDSLEPFLEQDSRSYISEISRNAGEIGEKSVLNENSLVGSFGQNAKNAKDFNTPVAVSDSRKRRKVSASGDGCDIPTKSVLSNTPLLDRPLNRKSQRAKSAFYNSLDSFEERNSRSSISELSRLPQSMIDHQSINCENSLNSTCNVTNEAFNLPEKPEMAKLRKRKLQKFNCNTPSFSEAAKKKRGKFSEEMAQFEPLASKSNKKFNNAKEEARNAGESGGAEPMDYKCPKLKRPKRWVTDRLYDWIIKKLEKRYKLRARLRSERFVEFLCTIVETVIKKEKDFKSDVNDLKIEMARLDMIENLWDFYCFIESFLPWEFEDKAVPIPRPFDLPSVFEEEGSLFDPIL